MIAKLSEEHPVKAALEASFGGDGKELTAVRVGLRLKKLKDMTVGEWSLRSRRDGDTNTLQYRVEGKSDQMVAAA